MLRSTPATVLIAATGLHFSVLPVAAEIPLPRQIETKGPLGPLRGTFQPSGAADAPIVLILPGSGPTDRDGNNPYSVSGSSYRLLAEGLATQGIASVRIDKRGLFGSKDAVIDGNDVTIEAYAEDVSSWIATISATTGNSCVWLAGHSEGGLIALVSARKASGVCGLVLLATAGRKLGDVLRTQLKANPANGFLLPSAFDCIDKLERGERFDTAGLHPALMPLFHERIQKYWINLMSHDPARLISDYKGPVLIVQGDADVQVLPQDAHLLAAAQPHARLEIRSGMNHTLKVSKADEPAATDLPLAPGLAELIADFVRTAR